MPNKNKNKNNKKKQAIPRIEGNGGYYSDVIAPFMSKIVPDGTFNKTGMAMGARAGSLAGARYGMPKPGAAIGARLGGYLGSGISKLVGFGDYAVENNSLAKSGMAIPPGEAVPSFGVMGHATRVRHREYLGDIAAPASPTVFTNTSYTINPGNSLTFPWLSALAASYQQYRFEGLIFEFKTLSSDITTGGALGAVIMAANYDALEASYGDKVHMENAQYSVSAKPSCSQIHTIECDPAASDKNLWYVRDLNSSTTPSQDNRFYDLGNFQIATTGLPATAGTVLGELWVSYDVSLFKPKIGSPAGGSRIIAATSITKSVIFGTAPVTTGAVLATLSGSIMTFVAGGDYIFSAISLGTGLALPTLTGTATSSILWSEGATALTSRLEVIRVRVQTGQTLIFDYSGSTTLTGFSIRAGPYTYTLA